MWRVYAFKDIGWYGECEPAPGGVVSPVYISSTVPFKGKLNIEHTLSHNQHPQHPTSLVKMVGDTGFSKNPWDMPVHSSNKATTLNLENSLARQKPKPSKDVPWYQKEIKALAPETRDFLAGYTGIKDEEQLKQLIYKVRDMAWDV